MFRKFLGLDRQVHRDARCAMTRPRRYRPGCEPLEDRRLLATFTVNSTNDVDDGICNSAHCSLREAINAANNAIVAFHEIRFSIPGAGVHTIRPLTPLPAVTAHLGVTIDG